MKKYDKEILQGIIDWHTRKDFSNYDKIQEYLDKSFNGSCLKDDKDAKTPYELGVCISLVRQLFDGYKELERIIKEK